MDSLITWETDSNVHYELNGYTQRSEYKAYSILDTSLEINGVYIRFASIDDAKQVAELIEYGMIEKVGSKRGEYMVSRSIKEL